MRNPYAQTNRLFSMAREDMASQRAGIHLKVAFKFPGSASSRMGKAVAADSAQKIINPVVAQANQAKRTAGIATRHARNTMYSSPRHGGTYAKQNAMLRGQISPSGQVSLQRRVGVAPGLARMDPSLAAAAPAVAAPAVATQSPAAGSLIQQQANSTNKQLVAQQKAQKASQRAVNQPQNQGALQVLNGDYEAAQTRATQMQGAATKAQQTAQAMQQQAAPGMAPGAAPGAPMLGQGSSLLGMEMSAKNRQRAMMGAGVAGVGVTGYLASKYMKNNNNDQGQY